MPDVRAADRALTVERLVVVGASLAGIRAVEGARRAGYTGEIALVGGEPHEPYDRPPLSKAFLADDERPPAVVLRNAESLRDDLGVDVRLGTPASALDTAARELVVGDDRIGFDSLVIATGSTPRTLPGAESLTGIHTLRTFDDAMAIRNALDAGARTVVIGAGFIGSEIASSARQRGLEVTVIEALPTPLTRAIGTPMGHAVTALHARNGATLLLGSGVAAIEGTGQVEAVVLESGLRIEADLVVAGIGVTPATEWLETSGLELANGIVADETLRTSEPGIYAAGDVVSWFNSTLGERQRLENWTGAAEQGGAAGRNAADPQSAKPFGTVPYFWSDWYGSRIQFVGSPIHDDTEVVVGDPASDDRWVTLYRRGDRLIGALSLNGASEIMKYRGLIARGATWHEGLEFAAERRLARAAAAAS